jgi:hypothetical protein
MSCDPIALPTSLQWLDDAARTIYEASHRFAEGNGYTPQHSVGHRYANEGRQGSPRSWEQVLAVYPGWCFHAAIALPLCKPTRDQAINVVVWAWEQARGRGEEHADRRRRFGVHAFIAPAEEAERILRQAVDSRSSVYEEGSER